MQGVQRIKSSGFTLMELIAVIVVLVVLASAVTLINTDPNLTTYHDADKLAADIRYVQSYSMTHADNYSILISENSGVWQYQLFLDATPLRNPTTGSTDAVTLLSTVTLPSEISAGRITFDGRGVPYGNSDAELTTTAVITLAFENDRDTEVHVTPKVGKVTVVPV